MAGEETKVFWLSYPDPLAIRVKMRFVVGQLQDADDGVVKAQNAICARYKMAAGLPRSFTVSWGVLRAQFEPSTEFRDTSESRRLLNKKIRKARL